MTSPELTVRHVMDKTPVAVAPDCPVSEILRLMNHRRIGSVLVVRETDRLFPEKHSRRGPPRRSGNPT